ncbi:hypothetical protein F5Y17DRAFT_308462 [Xylariaceae sp. FL0594]|nr:hypothetical protein F5Y17DRAFT_308462 [Xylariaceae sp. FL0594]
MPARRASNVSPVVTTNTTTGVFAPATAPAADGGTPRGEPPRKRSKVYDNERIEADIRAIYPNWVSVDPSLLMEHGFAGSHPSSTTSPPSSSSRQRHDMQDKDNNSNGNALTYVSRVRLDSLSSSQGGGSPVQLAPLTTPAQAQQQAEAAAGKGKGKSKGRRGTKAKKNNNSNNSNVTRAGSTPLRNEEHDIPEITEGVYASFLDRHGQRPEHFPHAMLRRLEKERLKRSVVVASARTHKMPATPESLPSPCSPKSLPNRRNSSNSASDTVASSAVTDNAAYTNNSSTTITSNPNDNNNTVHNSNREPSQHTHSRNGNPYVWVVTHTQQGGYDRFRPVRRGIPESSGASSGVRFHGVYPTLEDANVRAMEVFQKLHRDFMLNAIHHHHNNGSRSLSLGLLGPGSLSFVEMPENNNNYYYEQDNNNNNDEEEEEEEEIGPGSLMTAPQFFFESHPALEEDEAEAEGASWWVDDWGCLSLRAMNWGTGDSRIFVARQEFNR